MDKLDALEIVWKMLPMEATDLQKEAWQTVKRIVHTPQADNNRSDEIALLEDALSCMPASWQNSYGDTVRQRINVRIAQLRAVR